MVFSLQSHFQLYHHLTFILKILEVVTTHFQMIYNTLLSILCPHIFLLIKVFWKVTSHDFICIDARLHFKNIFQVYVIRIHPLKALTDALSMQYFEILGWKAVHPTSTVILHHWTKNLYTNHHGSINLHVPYAKMTDYLMFLLFD